MTEEEKKKLIAPHDEEPAAEPEEENEEEEITPAPEPENAFDFEMFKKLLKELMREIMMEEETRKETDEEGEQLEAEIKKERERVCNLISFENVVDKKIILDTIQNGGDEKDLGLKLLNQRRAEMDNKKNIIKNSAEEKPLASIRGASSKKDELEKILKELNLK